MFRDVETDGNIGLPYQCGCENLSGRPVNDELCRSTRNDRAPSTPLHNLHELYCITPLPFPYSPAAACSELAMADYWVQPWTSTSIMLMIQESMVQHCLDVCGKAMEITYTFHTSSLQFISNACITGATRPDPPIPVTPVVCPSICPSVTLLDQHQVENLGN